MATRIRGSGNACHSPKIKILRVNASPCCEDSQRLASVSRRGLSHDGLKGERRSVPVFSSRKANPQVVPKRDGDRHPHRDTLRAPPYRGRQRLRQDAEADRDLPLECENRSPKDRVDGEAVKLGIEAGSVWRRPANSPRGYSWALTGSAGLKRRRWIGSRNASTVERYLLDTPSDGAGGSFGRAIRPFLCSSTFDEADRDDHPEAYVS